MKTFEEICYMSQKELKEYLAKYLRSKGYTVVKEDGFLYAKAKEENPVRVLLVAHMDTVHKERIKELEKIPYVDGDNIITKVTSPQGIGGDDRCGIYMIMNIIKKHNVSVLFAEDEEIGCVGSRKFTQTQYCKDLSDEIDYMIELDRQGSKDAVFYDCDNPDFTKWIETETGYKKAYGSFTDISKLMPVTKIAGVNFSCGYYHAHTLNEYVVLEEMKATQDMVCELLSKKIPQQFEFIEKKYYGNYGSYGSYSSYYNDYSGFKSSYNGHYGSGFGGYSRFLDEEDDDDMSQSALSKKDTSKGTSPKAAMIDKYVYLTVYVNEDIYGIPELKTKGDTKAECWMNLFMEYDDLCYGYIEDYFYE